MGKITPTFADQQKGNGSAVNMPPNTPFVFASPQGLTQIIPPNKPLHIPVPPPSRKRKEKQLTVETISNIAPLAEPAPLKVALIGTAPSSRMLAPFADQSWKIWACSPGNMNILPRVDVWFEIHGNLLWPENRSYGEPYIEWLKKQTFPIYMQDNVNVPNATPFPKEEMVQKFGKDFFTSSFAWMMAKAIDDGAKEIALFGIDMASRDEYILQRPSFYFFKYVAEQKGIKVWAPNESDIMQPPGLYGFSEVTPFGRKVLARRKELQDRLAGLRQQRDQFSHNITYLEGAIEDIDYIQSIWLGQG